MGLSYIYTVPQDISTGGIATRIHNLWTQNNKKKPRNQLEEKASLFFFPTHYKHQTYHKKTGDKYKRHKGTD